MRTPLSEYLSVEAAVSGGKVRTLGNLNVRPSLPSRSCAKIGHARRVTAAPIDNTTMSGSAITASTVPTTMSTPRLMPTQHLDVPTASAARLWERAASEAEHRGICPSCPETDKRTVHHERRDF